jgi:hypothetical protein
MHLVKMVKEQRLVSKFQPVRKTEKRRMDHHDAGAPREKGATKEKPPVLKQEAVMKAATMMMQSKGMLGTKKRFTLKVVKVAKSLEAGVTEASMKASQSPSTSSRVGADLGSEEEHGESNRPYA